MLQEAKHWPVDCPSSVVGKSHAYMASTCEAFSRRALLVMVAKTLQLTGAGMAAEQRALDVMVDLIERYLEETGRLSGQYRDLAGRS